MAATKSTKKKKTIKAVKTTSKAKVTSKKSPVAKKATEATKVKKIKKTVKPEKKAIAVKNVSTAKKTSAVKTLKTKTKTKTKSVKKTSSKKTVISSLFSDVVKQAVKAEKVVQSQTKAYIKLLNTQDKQLAQLSKKLTNTKGKSRQSVDTKINKLQDQMSTTRSELLASETNADKIATLIEWVNQLSSKPDVTAYMQTNTHVTTSRPTLINSSNKKSSSPASDVYAEETEDLDFGYDEDLDESLNR